MVTYSELIQFGTFIVALIGLCYQIFIQILIITVEESQLVVYTMKRG